MRIAKIILSLLAEKPLRWTDLEKQTTKVSPTYARFRATLQWLYEKGYITKLGRGKYTITEKGAELTKII